MFFGNDDMLDHTCLFQAKFGGFFDTNKAVTASCDYRLFFDYCDADFVPSQLY